jgi:hypothetical protein
MILSLHHKLNTGGNRVITAKIKMTTIATFTITRTTRNGILEFLTEQGFRSENAIFDNRLEKLHFTQDDGSRKVRELRSNCRLPKLAKSIILNY